MTNVMLVGILPTPMSAVSTGTDLCQSYPTNATYQEPPHQHIAPVALQHSRPRKLRLSVYPAIHRR